MEAEKTHTGLAKRVFLFTSPQSELQETYQVNFLTRFSNSPELAQANETDLKPGHVELTIPKT